MRKPILADHRRIGKKFYPPAARLGWTEVHYIERILPEITWIGYFVERFGPQRGSEIVEKFLHVCYSASTSDSKPELCFCSALGSLSSSEWTIIRKRCKAKGIFLEVLDALTPFVRCYPSGNSLLNIFEEPLTVKTPSPSDVDRTRAVISQLFDRRSQTASVVQSIIPKIEIEIGKYHVPQDYPFLDFDSIITAFESEHTKSLCAHVRMDVNSSFMMHEGRIGTPWARYFWNRGRDLAPLSTDNVEPKNAEQSKHPMIKFGVDYEQYAWGIVDAIWSKFPVDIFESEVAEVVGALLARQCNLAGKVARNPDLWDYHAGPLFLRSMTDVYITAAWILKDPKVRARQFIQFGLGQEKLHVERLKAALADQQPDEAAELQEGIEAREAWINSQRYSFLQHVDVGSWSGISTRRMAEEADCIDLYDFAYCGWSQGAHSTWNHVGRFDVFPSAEPLHKHIWQPANLPHGFHSDVVINATKYFDKLAVYLVDEFKIEMSVPRPSEWLWPRLNQLQMEIESMNASAPSSAGASSKER